MEGNNIVVRCNILSLIWSCAGASARCAMSSATISFYYVNAATCNELEDDWIKLKLVTVALVVLSICFVESKAN